jgi:LuxR family maltose regulon positive regulatory protein
MLELLDQMNLFLIPLDDHRSWFRYHHLFAELIQQLSRQKLSNQVTNLHRNAREWYQQNGLMSEAMYHGTAEGNFDQVANLIEQNFTAVMEHRDWISLTRWLDALPTTVIQSRPWLCVAYAYILLDTEDTRMVPHHIQQAVTALNNGTAKDADHIHCYIDYIQAELSALSGEMEKTIEFAKKSLAGIPLQDERLRCLAASTLGTALQRIGDFPCAADAFLKGISAGRNMRDTNAVITLYGDLIGLYVEQGQLHQAFEYCQEALHYIEDSYQKRGRYIPGAAYIHFRLSTILRHWGDLEGSLEQAQKCHHILNKWGMRYPLNYINLAIALHAVGEHSEAHKVLDDGEIVAMKQSSHMAANVKSTRVQFWLKEGKLENALQWARDRELDFDGVINYQDQLVYRTLAQVRLAQGENGDRTALDELLRFLPRFIKVVEESGAVAYLLQTLIIQALALQLAGGGEEAIESMKRTLILGENGGYIWVFVRTGQPMELLLRSTIERKGSTPYIEELLNAFDRLKAVNESEIREHPDLPDPLTAREHEVLTLLNSDLSIPEIAATLVISPATLRTHIKRIYRKLDVHSRFEAVTRARERQLTDVSPSEI